MSEVWLDVSGFEGLYMVSNCGRVMRCDLKRERILKPTITTKGYLRVMLCNKELKNGFMVHRLVGLAFLQGFADGLQINHINGVKADNLASNLEWVTPSQNIQHAFDNGLNHGQCNAAAITGRLGSSFKGLIEAAEIGGCRHFTMEGNKHIKACGFNPQNVYDCVNGKRNKHKGFRFIRVPLNAYTESMLLRAGSTEGGV